jgi:hypothetical protein
MSVDAAFRQMIRAEIESQLKPLQNVVSQLQQSTADLETLRALANGLAPFAGLLGVQLPAAAPAPRGRKPGAAKPGRKPRAAAAAASEGAVCAIIGCGAPARTKGYCSAHYQKLRMLIRTDRRPATWVDFPAPASVPDLVLPRGRAAVAARKKANG